MKYSFIKARSSFTWNQHIGVKSSYRRPFQERQFSVFKSTPGEMAGTGRHIFCILEEEEGGKKKYKKKRVRTEGDYQ